MLTICKNRTIKRFTLAFLLGIGFASFLFPVPFVYAQDDGGTNASGNNDAVYQVASELWCPLCSGVRLDACELKACAQMRQEISLRLAAGDDTEAIKAYFVEQYGPQVLGEPPREGFNWLAWIVPFVALALGAVVILIRWRTILFAKPETPIQGTEGATRAPNPVDAQNSYEKKLDEELNRLRS